MSGELFYGDNLDVLRRHVNDEAVDLIYLDPPFNSNASYNVLFGAPEGEMSTAQIKAFDDTWHWDLTAAAALEEVVTAGGRPAEAMLAFKKLLGPSSMLAYLAMMAPRLIELRRVLKPTGSIYLHCDPTASHYLKLLLDSIFGPDNFRNEIIWQYKYGSRSRKDFGRKHDVIFRYSKTKKCFFDDAASRIPFEPASLEQNFRHVDEDGRRYRTGTWKNGKEYRYYADEGRARDDVWTDIGSLHQADKERLGYPTQKPVALLKVIIETSCPQDGVVLDPFCGCGTTVVAACELDRDWVGIDITSLSINLIKSRLAELGVTDYTTKGEPQSVEDAEKLAAEDPFQFQFWVLGLIGARPTEEKKGPDQGIDGRLYFFIGQPDPCQLVASVKAGKTTVQHVRDLRGVIEREDAEVGVLITNQEPTAAMRKEAASAGFFSSPYGKHPRLQLITAAELLSGATLDLPPEAFQRQEARAAQPGAPAPEGQMTLGSED